MNQHYPDISGLYPEEIAALHSERRDRHDAFALGVLQAAAAISASDPQAFEQNVPRVLTAFVALRLCRALADFEPLDAPGSSA